MENNSNSTTIILLLVIIILLVIVICSMNNITIADIQEAFDTWYYETLDKLTEICESIFT